MNKKILVVEDQPVFQQIIQGSLKSQYDLELVSNLNEAMRFLSHFQFDLVLLDIVLPDGDGLQLYDQFRNSERLRNTPVIFISGKNDINTKLLAFNLGADDYLTKPFEPLELKARIQRLLMKAEKKEELLYLTNLKVNLSQMKVETCVENQWHQIDLTTKEFLILKLMITNNNSVLTREKILDFVWGQNTFITDRTVDSHVSNLRKKLKTKTISIESVRGVGYRIAI